MECWVSKQGKKGAWSSFLKEFLENIKKKIFDFNFIDTFKTEICSKKLRVGYVYLDYGSGKCPMDERVKCQNAEGLQETSGWTDLQTD